MINCENLLSIAVYFAGAFTMYRLGRSDGYYRGMREGFSRASETYFKARRNGRESTDCLKCRQEEVEKNIDPK